MMDKDKQKRLMAMYLKIDTEVRRVRKIAFAQDMANMQIAYGFDYLFSLN